MFPPLLIAPNPDPAKRLIKQTTGADPKRMTLPPGVFLRKAPGPGFVGVAQQNGRMFQVRTNAAFSAPANVLGSAFLKAGGRTGAAITTLMGSGSNIIRYAKLAAQFGGPAQIKVVPATPIRVWARDKAAVPCKHPSFGGADTNCIAYLLPAYPGALAAPGAKVGFATMTVGGPPVSNNVVAVSVPKATGLVAKSAVVGKVVLTNVASSSGFPWTTGKVTISAPSAFGIPERFTLTGMDSRVNGVGTISLVSGALSKRTITAANANRGWLRLTVPEPGALVGAAAALGTLAACHFLMRRRARRAGD
jgi:hypothetical protein